MERGALAEVCSDEMPLAFGWFSPCALKTLLKSASKRSRTLSVMPKILNMVAFCPYANGPRKYWLRNGCRLVLSGVCTVLPFFSVMNTLFVSALAGAGPLAGVGYNGVSMGL